VDADGDQTTIKQGISKDEAYAAAQADATRLGLQSTLIDVLKSEI
jgi:hypothetical protein